MSPKPEPKKAASPKLYPVIMAGGSGTRFWPLSRRSRPKQFLALASKRPLFTDTAARLDGLALVKDIFVVCGKLHAKPALRMVKGLKREQVLVEPLARNTAPAIALATAHVAARDPNGIIAVLPSDQHVSDVPGFRAALAEAARTAEQGFIVTLGIKPSRPETGYGYIRTGEAFSGLARRVQAFVEKPNAQTAMAYFASGDYLWNAGIFVFRADVMLAAFKQHMPALDAGLRQIRAAIGKRTYPGVLAKVFPTLPAISIDYGVAERAENIAVVPGDFGWSDVGSFNALAEVRTADARGNVITGTNAVVVDCEGCVVVSGKRPLAVVGLTDVVVVDAGDAVLVLPKDRSQDVRKVVDELQARGLDRYL
ncbi:MAG: mannose-1-phosphate guanylyltransferase [Myxococcaceae bacterium]